MITNSKEYRFHILRRILFALFIATWIGGCVEMKSAHTISRDYSYGDYPVDPPPCVDGEPKYDDFVNGGQLFKMYCGSCHAARPLGDRSFAQTEVAFAHMRRHAYLTGKEYRQLIHFLRRWHDVGPPTPELESTTKRFNYSQPMEKLPCN